MLSLNQVAAIAALLGLVLPGRPNLDRLYIQMEKLFRVKKGRALAPITLIF